MTPKEYQNLGNALTKKRKDNAEYGSSHSTARRLGALFEGVCPSTPSLIKVYGVRVSEIAKAANSACSEHVDGIFADHIGVDGTSIWAAATSSSTALHVQLLACMLARVWSASEATSIWYELVQERRKSIAEKFESGVELNYATLSAIAQETSRENLAEWDASARSWLRTADTIKKIQQEKLILCIAKVKGSINEDKSVLSSVLAAWHTALESVEMLIVGMPQADTGSATLLALSSWHIYPDLLMVGCDTREISFNDPCVTPGGTLTLGLGPEKESATNHGPKWSLSLAHLKYYGRPIQKNTCLTYGRGKISYMQLTQAVFGCLLDKWGLSRRTDTAARFFISFQASLERFVQNGEDSSNKQIIRFLSDSTHWWNLITTAAWSFLDKSGDDQDSVKRLVALGLRRAESFIPGSEQRPLFGFLKLSVLLKCLKGPEERINYLRSVASRASAPGDDDLFIRYSEWKGVEKIVNYATAVPQLQKLKKRKHETQTEGMEIRHRRWLDNRILERCVSDEEIVLLDSREFCPDLGDRGFYHVEPGSHLPVQYMLYHGDVQLAAIFGKSDMQSPPLLDPSLEDLIYCLDHDMFSSSSLLNHLITGANWLSPIDRTMVGLQNAAQIYRLLPHAGCSVETLETPLHTQNWVSALIGSSIVMPSSEDRMKNLISRPQAPLTREIALSCISFMETGLNIDPGLLENVLALAFENSIYISMQLTCDPWEQPAPYEMKRALGNIGRPGLTFLVSPKEPIMRPKDPDSWKVISNEYLHQNAQDCFPKTSLHLSFTNDYRPLYQGPSHEQDNDVFFLESVVSVYDSGAWVGDIDILSALKSERIHRTLNRGCDHALHQLPMPKLLAVGCWDDILDPPIEDFVIVAQMNWIARLASVGIALQSIKDSPQRSIIAAGLLICPNLGCYICNIQSAYPRNNGSILNSPRRTFIL